MSYFVYLLIAVLCLLVMSSCHSRNGEVTPPEVDFCTLKEKPNEYNGKLVSVNAYIHRDPENFSVYDVRCNKDTFVWAEYDDAVVEKERAMLQDALCQTKPCLRGEARVRVTGRFEGPSETGYGHLNDYRFKFIMTRINEAYPVRP